MRKDFSTLFVKINIDEYLKCFLSAADRYARSEITKSFAYEGGTYEVKVTPDQGGMNRANAVIAHLNKILKIGDITEKTVHAMALTAVLLDSTSTDLKGLTCDMLIRFIPPKLHINDVISHRRFSGTEDNPDMVTTRDKIPNSIQTVLSVVNDFHQLLLTDTKRLLIYNQAKENYSKDVNPPNALSSVLNGIMNFFSGKVARRHNDKKHGNELQEFNSGAPKPPQ